MTKVLLDTDVAAVVGVVDDAVATFTNKRNTRRFSTVASTTTLTVSVADYDGALVTAQAADITIANPTGTPVIGDVIAIYLTDNGTTRAITFGSNFKAFGAALPTDTTVSKTLLITAQYYATDSFAVLSAELQ